MINAVRPSTSPDNVQHFDFAEPLVIAPLVNDRQSAPNRFA